MQGSLSPPTRGCKGWNPSKHPQQGKWVQGSLSPLHMVAKGGTSSTREGLEASKDPGLPQIKLLWVSQQRRRFIALRSDIWFFPDLPMFRPGQLRGHHVGYQTAPAMSPLACLHLFSAYFPLFFPEMSCFYT